MRLRHLVAAVAIGAGAAAFAASAFADPTQSPDPFADDRYVEPLTFSPACATDIARQSACAVVRNFFANVNSRNFGKACQLLGKWLRRPWHGVTCEASLDGMVVQPVPWGIRGAQLGQG